MPGGYKELGSSKRQDLSKPYHECIGQRFGFGKHVTCQWHWLEKMMVGNGRVKTEKVRQRILGNLLFIERQGIKLPAASMSYIDILKQELAVHGIEF